MEIIPTEYFPLPTELIDYLNMKKITIASWVPTVLSIVAQLNPFSLVKTETLKKVFFVCEVMPMKHLNKWREALPDLQLICFWIDIDYFLIKIVIALILII